MMVASPSPSAERHIVDVLLAERAPHLVDGPLWQLMGPLRDGLFGYRAARAMADAIAPLSGGEALAHVSGLLALNVATHGLQRMPATGRCIVVANHPTGIADGVAVYDAIMRRRADLSFLANADARRICPRFDEVLVPVVWPASRRTRAATRRTLSLAREALEAERAVVIFAAGEMSKRRDGILRDPPWERSAVALARRHRAPIVPVRVAGPNSFLFHLFHRFSRELRNITLFHEMLNKAGGHFALRFGAPVDPHAAGLDSGELTRALQSYVERALAADADAAFLPAAADGG